MRRHLRATDRVLEPFHLDQVEMAPVLDQTIDLLDDASALISFQHERFADRNPMYVEQLIQDPCQSFATLPGIGHSKQGIEAPRNSVPFFAHLLPLALLLNLHNLPRLALFLPRVIHSGERIFGVHDFLDARNEPLSGEALVVVSRGEGLPLYDSPENFAARAYPLIAELVEFAEHILGDLNLEDTIPACADFRPH